MLLNIANDEIEQVAYSLRTIANPMRLKILCELGKGEQNVHELVSNVGTTQSNISQHLGVLSRRGLLVSRRDTRYIYYRLNDTRMLPLLNMVQEVFCRHAQHLVYRQAGWALVPVI